MERLDYSKGLPQKLAAVQRYLEEAKRKLVRQKCTTSTVTLRPSSAVIVELMNERSIKANETCKLKCQLLRNEDDDSESRMDKMEELRRRFERLGTHKASPSPVCVCVYIIHYICVCVCVSMYFEKIPLRL